METLALLLKYHHVNKLDFNFYPNPNKGDFFIDTKTRSNIEIINLLGKTVYSKEINNSQIIHCNTLKKGSYFLRVSQGRFSETKKIIIK